MDVQWMFRILEKWCCSLNSGSARVTEVPRAVCEGAGGCWRLVNSCMYQPLCWRVDNVDNVDNDNNDDNVDNFALCVREQEDAGGWSTLISNNHLFNKNKKLVRQHLILITTYLGVWGNWGCWSRVRERRRMLTIGQLSTYQPKHDIHVQKQKISLLEDDGSWSTLAPPKAWS